MTHTMLQTQVFKIFRMRMLEEPPQVNECGSGYPQEGQKDSHEGVGGKDLPIC